MRRASDQYTDGHVVFQSGGDEDAQQVILAAAQVALHSANTHINTVINTRINRDLCVCDQTVDGGRSGLRLPPQVVQVPSILCFCCSQEDRQESVINSVQHEEVSDVIVSPSSLPLLLITSHSSSR